MDKSCTGEEESELRNDTDVEEESEADEFWQDDELQKMLTVVGIGH